MAYSRWGRNSNWYIFHEFVDDNKPEKENETLACWFADGIYLSFSYPEIKEMLKASDFSSYVKRLYPPCNEHDVAMLFKYMKDFTEDIETDYLSEEEVDE